jgi:hypothetical protein
VADLLTRDEFIREMTDEMKMSVGLGLRKGTAWMPIFHQEKTDKRREEMGTWVHPSVSFLTEEGGAFKRGEVKHGFSSFVVPLTYTLEVKVSGEFIEDNRMKDVEKQYFGLGKAFQRRRYKRACQILYNGYSAVTGPNGKSLFNDSQTLAATSDVTDDNLLTAPLTTDAFDEAVSMLLTQYDENGDVYDADVDRIRIIVPPQNWRPAAQIAGSEQEPENMNNAINVYSGQYGKYKVEVISLPLLFEAPSAFRSSQWYVQLIDDHELYFFERKAVDTWQIPDPNSTSVLVQGRERSEFLVNGYRGMAGSKGLG